MCVKDLETVGRSSAQLLAVSPIIAYYTMYTII